MCNAYAHAHPNDDCNFFFSIFRIVAWFTFDLELSNASGSGLVFSNDLSTVSVDGWDHCVALGSVGFSRGIHYWEFTINKYTPDTDPAFGIARIDVARDQMLGKFNDDDENQICHKNANEHLIRFVQHCHKCQICQI